MFSIKNIQSYPYQFASNTPIGAIDLDGLEAFLAIAGNAYGAAWDKNHRKFFKAQAERLEKTYAEYSAYTVSTGEDILKIMIEATQREGSISSIAFFTHGGDLGFYLNNDAGLFYNSSVVSPNQEQKHGMI